MTMTMVMLYIYYNTLHTTLAMSYVNPILVKIVYLHNDGKMG